MRAGKIGLEFVQPLVAQIIFQQILYTMYRELNNTILCSSHEEER